MFPGYTIKGNKHLIIIVMPMEEGLLLENHTGKHATQAPHVQGIIVHLSHKVKVSFDFCTTELYSRLVVIRRATPLKNKIRT